MNYFLIVIMLPERFHLPGYAVDSTKWFSYADESTRPQRHPLAISRELGRPQVPAELTCKTIYLLS